MRSVAITLYRRPLLTERLFASLAQCHGVEGSHLFISCDWSDEYASACDEVIAQAEAFDACATSVYINKPKRLGIDEAKLFIIPKALSWGGYAVVMEDDCLPSADALRFFDYCGEAYSDDPRVVSVTGYNRIGTPAARIDPYRLEFRRAYRPWGWATWADRWERLFGDNAAAYRAFAGERVNGLFDTYMQDSMAASKGVISPSLSRIHLDGWEDAEHPHPRWYHDSEEANYHCSAHSLNLPDPAPELWHE